MLLTTRGWRCVARWGCVFMTLSLLATFSPSKRLGSVEGNAEASPDEGKKPKSAAWVLLIAEGKRQRILTQARTVKELLTTHHIRLNDDDRVEPALSTPIRNFLKVRITRVRVETITQQKTIPYQTEFRHSTALRRGESKVIQEGEPGMAEQEIKVWFKDGRVSWREPGETKVVKPPVNRIVMVGSSSVLASRGVRVRKVMTMIATGYSPDPRDNGKGAYGRTSTGLLAGYGTVAVDPRVIPYGTRLYVEGYGFAIAGDCGSAIKGNRIDLCYDSYERAQQVGRQKVKVFILE